MYQIQYKCLISFFGEEVNACMPDERDEFARLSVVYGQIPALGWAYGRQAFTVRLKNLLKE